MVLIHIRGGVVTCIESDDDGLEVIVHDADDDSGERWDEWNPSSLSLADRNQAITDANIQATQM